MNEYICSLPNYDGVALMNDYQHILDYHCRNCKTYEKVYQCMISKLGQPQSIEKSICVQRNYRDKSKYNTDNDKEKLIKLYFGFNDKSEINIQQILDSIYTYFIYSFDLIRLSPSNEKLLKQTVGNILKEEHHSSDDKKKTDSTHLDLDLEKNRNNKSQSKINLKFLKPLQSVMDKRKLQSKIIGQHHVEKNKFLTCVNNKPSVKCKDDNM